MKIVWGPTLSDQLSVFFVKICPFLADLKLMLKKIVDSKTDEERTCAFEPLSEILMNVHYANDEGDPGMGYELGIDMFSYGGKILHKSTQHLLTVAYDLLKRPEFSLIIQVSFHQSTGRKYPENN